MHTLIWQYFMPLPLLKHDRRSLLTRSLGTNSSGFLCRKGGFRAAKAPLKLTAKHVPHYLQHTHNILSLNLSDCLNLTTMNSTQVPVFQLKLHQFSHLGTETRSSHDAPVPGQGWWAAQCVSSS